MKRSVELRPDSIVGGAASSIRLPRLVTWVPRWCQQRHDGILAISTGLGQSASVALRGERRRRAPSAEAEGIRYSAISGGAHRAAGYPGRPPRRRVARHSRAAGSAEASCFRYLKSARGRSQEPHVHRNAVPARLPIHCKLCHAAPTSRQPRRSDSKPKLWEEHGNWRLCGFVFRERPPDSGRPKWLHNHFMRTRRDQ